MKNIWVFVKLSLPPKLYWNDGISRYSGFCSLFP